MNAALKELITPSDSVSVIAGTIIADDIPIDYELDVEDVDLVNTVELDAPIVHEPPPVPDRR